MKLRDTYVVERFLGEGGFAEVYRVKHRFLGRQALKLFKRKGVTQDEIQKTLDEALLLSRLGHPNVVRVFDANVCTVDGHSRGFFTMEYCAAGTLDTYWRRSGAASVPTLIDIMQQVCAGLTLAHSESPPIVHRDIKPQNILVYGVGDSLRAVVSDFGLAKRANPLTTTLTAAGTFAFKPPEVFSQDKADSTAGDVWAMGTTIYLLLTGTLPYDVDPHLGWGKRAVQDDQLIPPSHFNPSVSAQFDDVVKACLKTNPRSRIRNAAELLSSLDGVARSSSPASGPETDLAPMPSSVSVTLEAEEIVQRALRLAVKEGRPFEAAALLERAIRDYPALAPKFGKRLELWKRGVSM